MRAQVASVLRAAARRAGISPGALRSDLPEFFGIPSLIVPDLTKHWKRVIERSRDMWDSLPAPTGLKVACITTIARDAYNSAYTTVMAYALRLRGADPFIVYCDGVLAGCEFASNYYLTPQEFINKGPGRLCDMCTKPATKFYEQIGIPTYKISEFLNTEAYNEVDTFVEQLPREDFYNFTYHDMLLGPEVEASMARFYHNYQPEKSEEAWRVARRMVRGAVMMAEATRRMDAQLNPDMYLHNYAVYASRGSGAQVSKALGKRSAVWSRGYVEECIMIGENENAMTGLYGLTTGPWDELSMTPEQNQEFDDFLKDRIQGQGFRTFNKDAMDSKEELMKELKLDPSKPIVALFTTCGFDSKRLYDTELYPDSFKWLCDVIELFRNRPEQLVIRVHPGELWRPQVIKTLDSLKELIPTLPDNVRTIAPEEQLSSYGVARMSQVVMVYGSHIGLEAAAIGKPVIVAGRGMYAHKGFTYDIVTKEDTAKWLDRLDEISRPNPEHIAAARRFAYYFYFMRQIPFQHWNHDMHPDLRLKPWWKVFRSLNDLLPGRDINLDAICDQILHGKEACAVWPNGKG